MNDAPLGEQPAEFCAGPDYVQACICDEGYTGEQCLQECPSDGAGVECSGHGLCVNHTCSCDKGYGGLDCSRRAACPPKCEEHGVCSPSDRSCLCHPGYVGDACDTLLTCPADCSGHGRCDEGRCSCDEGYSADDCSVFALPQRPPRQPTVRRFEAEAARGFRLALHHHVAVQPLRRQYHSECSWNKARAWLEWATVCAS